MRKKKQKYRVVFVPDPVCWTEAPESLSVLARQRKPLASRPPADDLAAQADAVQPQACERRPVRLPVLRHLRAARPRSSRRSATWWSSCRILLGILDVQFFLMFLAVAIFYGMFLSIAAILLEEISFRRYPGWIDLTKLLAYSILENFGYRQLLSAMKVKAFWDAIRRRRAWGHMQRRGFRHRNTPGSVSHLSHR
jgi:hypothetical protein